MGLPDTACIIVGTNGFVWYAPKVEDNGEYIHMSGARIIWQWGTENGLAQLVAGPTKNTALDAASDVILNKAAFIYAIPCKAWP